MGVSGSGKTTVARAVADRLSWPFVEGDDLHSSENVAKMAGGAPLTDEDRAPWLEAIARQIRHWYEAGSPGVVTCSALKRAYRETLLAGIPTARVLFLTAPRELLKSRLTARKGHFMPTSLLDSQLETLEPPAADERPITVDVSGSVEASVAAVVNALQDPSELKTTEG